MRVCTPVCVPRICASWEGAPAAMHTHTQERLTLTYTSLQEEIFFNDLQVQKDNMNNSVYI